MKKITLVVMMAIAVTLGSCSNENPLTESSAKKALKKEAIFNKDNLARKFKLGYYDASEDELQTLAKLQAAGMITFTVDKVVEHISRRERSYWSSYVVNKKVNHYFVNVAMTEEGKKHVIEERVTLRDDLAKDMKLNEGLEEAVPEYMNATYAIEEDSEEVVEDGEVIEENNTVAEADTSATETSAEQSPEADPNAAYNAARSRVNVEEVYVRLGRHKLLKIKEVKCTEDMYKAGKGSARAFIEFTDKTPFGYVFDCPANGFVTAVEVDFTLYQDMGWLVSEVKD